MKLIFIEGVPSSGKSTMAKMLCDIAQKEGVNSSWYLEQSIEHPIHPVNTEHNKHDHKFAVHCLKQWQKFVSANKAKDHLFILDGSLFQSTIRFMLEGNNTEQIADYYTSCQSILSTIPSNIIYLRPPEINSHIEWTMKHRGESWTSKVAGYLEKTPYCSQRQWLGKDGMRSFWSDYAQLCDSLILQTTLPCHTIEAGYGHFESQIDNVLSHINNDHQHLLNAKLLAF